MIKNLLIKHLPIKQLLIKHYYNQIAINKVINTNSINKISYLNISAYNLTKTNKTKHLSIESTNKAYNKTFITYNHLKGSKQAFNYKAYKSIKVIRFCPVAMLKCFKSDINKKVRLRIYKWGLIKIMLLTSNNKLHSIILLKVCLNYFLK